SVSGGSPNYSYAWTKANAPDGTASSLSDTPSLGSTAFGLTVTDSKSCMGSASATGNVYDYSSSLQPLSATQRRRCTTPYTVSAASTGAGAPAGVALAFAPLPAGVSGAGLPATLNFGGSAQFTITSTSVGAGKAVTVNGTSGGGTRSATGTLNVYDYMINL